MLHLIILVFLTNVGGLHASNNTGQTSREDGSISIIFVGDISFDGCVRKYVDQGYISYNDTMLKVAKIIRKADIAVGNLESAFVSKSMQKYSRSGVKRLRRYSDARSASALQFAGFDVMTISNNHLNDFADRPVTFTKDVLSKVEIETFGYNIGTYDSQQRSVILEKKGIKVGFLGYCDFCLKVRKTYKAGAAIYRNDIAERDVRNLKRKGVDVVTVYMHWGTEFTTSPTTRQLRIAKYLHSLGVAAVIGAHPHTLQEIRKTNHQVTAYSLGNFLFPFISDCAPRYKNKPRNYPTRLSRIFRLQATRNGVIGASYLPVEIWFDWKNKILQPRLSNGTQWIDV